MDYKIVTKNAFSVIGKAITVSTSNGEGFARIPLFWRESKADGTVDAVESVSDNNTLIGVCLDFNSESESFTYMIATETIEDQAKDGLTAREIPTATWAVFTSIGPMPVAIQEVIKRIYQEWFPSTDYEHAGHADLEVYLPGDLYADDYRCEVWVSVIKQRF